MDKLLSVALIVVPILFAAGLGILARKKNMLSPQEVRGLQQFVIKFGLPCALFNSCLTAEISAQSVTTMILVIPLSLFAALWAIRARKKHYHFHNLPHLFCAKETGMLGVPLIMVLFGAAQSYRMGVLDLAQAVISIPSITILSASPQETPSPAKIIRSILTSPLLIFSLLGLVLNLTGIRETLDGIGIGGIITEATGFLGQPISAMMLFSVGYNFSLAKKDLKTILKLSALHFGMHAVFCGIVQLVLCFLPNVDAMTRWTMLMYYTLPASYLAPGLGRTEDDFTIASSVCSLLTVSCLIVFCIIAVIVA